MLAPAGGSFLDRDDERDVLERLLADARAGRSAVLLVRGDPGIGKTELLRYVADRAADFRVTRVVGVEAEMELPFSGLLQLCAPMLDRLGVLPEPQRDALSTALGLAGGRPRERFLISLATLSLLAAAAEDRPLLCLVDDVQWLDRATAQALAFAVRRLTAEAVGVVLTARTTAEIQLFEGLPELTVGGLAEHDAMTLLKQAYPGRLDQKILARVLAETRGNPLALLDLPRGMTAAELAGGFDTPMHDVPDRIEASYRRRISDLPYATQLLLLVAAAEPTGDAVVVWRAARSLGISAEALAPAEQAGLLHISGGVRFRHPLVRSTVYRASSTADRRTVHRALAEAIDSELDPDRRAWHLSAAADGPDEDIASELERFADRASARGGLAAASALLRRAAVLTPSAARRAERALEAAEASLRAGMFDAAGSTLTIAEAEPLSALQRARATLLRGQVVFAEGRPSDAPGLLLEAGEQLASLDADLAREAFLTAWGAAAVAGPFGADDLLATSRAIRRLAPLAGAPRPVDLLLDGLATLVIDGRAVAAPTLLRATEAFAAADASVDEGLRWSRLATAAGNALWDDAGVRALCERQLELARSAGALGDSLWNFFALGNLLARAGDLDACASLGAEASAIAEATGTALIPPDQVLLLAMKGNQAEAEALIETTLAHSSSHGQGAVMLVAHSAAALLYNGLQHYERALQAAEAAASARPGLYASMWALPELVEAAVHTGAHDVALGAVERLVETTRPAATDYGLGIEARCRALTSDTDAAEGLHEEAIQRLARTRMRADLARAYLLYGEWLQREGRVSEARQQLSQAHDMLQTMGMEAFAARARAELAHLGVTVRRPRSTGPGELTAQERQIAQLARDGLSNAEIGERVFLSPRTVEWHLHKVFAKLGIRSRYELRAALRDSEDG